MGGYIGRFCMAALQRASTHYAVSSWFVVDYWLLWQIGEMVWWFDIHLHNFAEVAVNLHGCMQIREGGQLISFMSSWTSSLSLTPPSTLSDTVLFAVFLEYMLSKSTSTPKQQLLRHHKPAKVLSRHQTISAQSEECHCQH